MYCHVLISPYPHINDQASEQPSQPQFQFVPGNQPAIRQQQASRWQFLTFVFFDIIATIAIIIAIIAIIAIINVTIAITTIVNQQQAGRWQFLSFAIFHINAAIAIVIAIIAITIATRHLVVLPSQPLATIIAIIAIIIALTIIGNQPDIRQQQASS